MAHVDAEGVGPGAQQPADHLGRAAGRAKRRQDLHLAPAQAGVVRIDHWQMLPLSDSARPMAKPRSKTKDEHHHERQ
jgi:hypothetical protein